MTRMTELLAPNIDPTLRDYIDFAIQEAVAPLVSSASLERVSYEAAIRRLSDDIERLKAGSK